MPILVSSIKNNNTRCSYEYIIVSRVVASIINLYIIRPESWKYKVPFVFMKIILSPSILIKFFIFSEYWS